MDRKRAAPGGVIIAEATLHRWAEGGKKEVRSKLVQAIQDGSHRNSGHSDDTLHRLLYELIWVAVNAKLPRQDVISLLKEADVASKSSASDTLTDLLWVIGNEVEANERGRERHSSTEWQNLCRLVKGVADEEIVSLLHLKSALEFDVLIGAGLMAGEPQALSRKVVRVNTKTLYLQVKYNLLREETEGFSKVLALLHTGVTKDQLATTKTDLLALIGYFDLDANRVLDLVLDAYEKHTTNDAFVDLLGSFKRESLPHVVGFKFQFYKRETGANDVGVSGGRVTPRSLYRLAATLIKKKLLTLDEIMPHLSPSRLEIVDESKKRIIELQQAARAFGKINLAAKTDDKDEEKDKADAGSDGGDVNNQIYGLIIGLLEIGARDMAFEMIDWFQKQGANPFMYKPLTLQLCSLVHTLIADLYAPLSYASMGFAGGAAVNGAEVSSALKYISPLSTLEECVKTVFPIVELMGPYLHHDELLLIKLVRISNHMVEQNNKQPVLATSDELTTVLKSLTVKAFLPSLSLQACNPSASYQIWDLVKVFPFDERYRMYLQWLGAYANHPELRLVEAQVVQNTRGVMRRLTADRAKASSRHLTHFAHSNPLIVFRTMLRQIQSYDNLIQPVVESFKFITPLGMDALSFILVSELSKPQKSMKADGTNVSLWLQSLANFSGSFYRKYPNVELEGLLQYLIKRLENWASVDLIVLSELLSKMGSCISLEDISVNQLEAQAGGPHLWHEPPTDPKLQNRRAIPLLRDALIKRNLALPLCILICQMRSKIEYQEDKALPHLKLLGRVYDTCQMTLTQLLQFMNGVVDPVVYKDMLPRLNALVHDYHVPAELAMTLCRPAIRCDDPVLRRAPRGINAPASKKAEQSSTEDAAWYMYSSKLLDDVGTALRSDNRDPFVGMTREMYVTFWSLTLYDIHIPFPQYEAEILRLRNSISGAAANNANLSSSERKKLKEKTMQQIDKLTNEQKDQVTHRKRVFERLEDAKSKFFVKEAAARQTAINELLQTCVVPRALLSPEDALFAAKFMERLHVMRTPVFSLLQYMHKVNMKLPPIVLCSTEREAGNFGIFLKETLLLVHRWYQSSGTYDEEAAHGFSTDLADPENPAKCLSFKQYKTTYVRWHRAAEKVYGTTLSSGEYMQIRNSLVVLTKIIDVFPSGKGAAEVLLDIVRPLTEEDREDIKIMAKRYFALLTKRKGALVDDKSLSARASRAFLKTVTDRVVPNERDDAVKRKDAGTDEEVLGEGRTEPVKARAGRTDDGSPSRGDELESGEIASYDSPPRPASNGRDSEHARDRRRESDRGNRGGSRERERDRGRERSRSHDRERNERGGRTDRSGSAENRDRRDADDERWSSRRREEHREASPGLSRETSDGSASGPRRDRQRDNAGRPHNRDGRDARGSGGGGRSSRERNDRPSEREGNPARSRGANGGGTPNENGTRDRDGGPEGDASTGSEVRKRPRVDADEAALRRQLTEKMKMDQQQRERTRDPTADTPPEDKQSQSPAPSGNQRKIVSLVSRKREREVGRPATPQGDTRDEGNSTGDSQAPETKRRRDDDKRNKGGRHNQKPKTDNAGGGGGNSQSRDQMRRQERANVNRSNDRRPADDQQRGGNGGGNRRRDNGNDQRGRRR